MNTRYGIYYPGASGYKFTLYRITTQAGLDEFDKIMSSVRGDGTACLIPEAMFHRLLALTDWDLPEADIRFVSDDPDDLEQSNYLEDLLEVKLDRGNYVGDLSDWLFYTEGSHVFLEISRWFY